ncbi:MAG: hypothetical protein PVH68_19060, partial [Armatimonadota bacterium]
GTIMIGFLQIPPVAIALLFVVVVANRIAGRLWARARLAPAELAVVYVMMLLAAMITSRGLAEDIYPVQAGLNYYATPANHWQSLFFENIKPSLVPWDPAGEPVQGIVRDYYEGLPAGDSVPWVAWLRSTGMWLVLIGFVYTAFMGMAAVVYRLWADEEHLSFPLTRLPLELITEPADATHFLRNKLTWIGFSLPVAYFGLNGLHQIWPQLPEITTFYRVRFDQLPWTGMNYTVMWFSLAGVGFFYLLSSEMIFSLWFFFLFARMREVIATALAGPQPRAPHAGSALFIGDETTGICFTLVGLMVYTAWARVRDIWREQARQRAEQSSSPITDTDVMLPFRTAALLVGLGVVGILGWWYWAGGSVVVALVEFGIYMFVQAIIMARATSDAGTPMTEGSFTPLDVWGLFRRRGRLGPANLTLLAFSNALFSRDLRGITLTGMLDAQSLADGVKLRRRKMPAVIIVALIFAVLVSGCVHLAVTYNRGGVTMYSYVYRSNSIAFWRQHAPLMEGVEEYRPTRLLWFGVGVLFCLFLGTMRRLYVWWPLHPLGAALSVTWIMCVFWFPALVAWLIKTAITRYGGLKSYTRLRPLFLGLIFGEFVMAVFWTIISFIFQTTAPRFPWP